MLRRLALTLTLLSTAAVVPLPTATAGPATELSTTTTSTTTTTTTTTARAGTGWSLRYRTRFRGLDGWTAYNGQTQGNDNSVNLAKNVSVGDRGLRIRGLREWSHGRPFTSGEIVGRSPRLVLGNYFRAEVTGRFRDERGVWPALLWFRPANAADGEIDVMEWMGGYWNEPDKRVAITMHNEYGATQDSIKRPMQLKYHPWFDPKVRHTYTIEKVPGSITVWIDGRQVARFTAADKAWWNRIMEAPGRTWYPRITLQIGSGAVTKVVPDPGTGWTRTAIRVHRLRIWDRG